MASIVQSTVVNSSSSNPTTASLSGVKASNQLILYSAYGGSGTPSVSSVTGGGTWAKITGEYATNLGADVELWWCPNATGGATTVTWTPSVTPYSQSVGIWLSEWSGLLSVDVAGTPIDATGGSPCVSPTITPTAGDLVLMAAGFENAPTVNPVAPWVNVLGAYWYGDSVESLPLAYQFAPSASPLKASWSASGYYAALGVAFKTVSSKPCIQVVNQSVARRAAIW